MHTQPKLLALVALLAAGKLAMAAVPADEAAKLNTVLTPLGAERRPTRRAPFLRGPAA